MTGKSELFDDWPEKYDQWFTTPLGRLVRKYESELILDLLKPCPGEKVLDAGCGTGVFTIDILSRGPRLVGLDISLPMLHRAREKTQGYPFRPLLGDMRSLPFRERSFDRVISMTALEFIDKAEGAVAELFRVAKRGGTIVVATLNSLSPWAEARAVEGRRGHAIFSKAVFRTPAELRALAPVEGVVRTAIHFGKGDDPDRALLLENEGRLNARDTGALVAVRWEKP